MTTYILTTDETARYDREEQGLMDDLRARYGDVTTATGPGITEVQHPDGFTVALLGPSIKQMLVDMPSLEQGTA